MRRGCGGGVGEVGPRRMVGTGKKVEVERKKEKGKRKGGEKEDMKGKERK